MLIVAVAVAVTVAFLFWPKSALAPGTAARQAFAACLTQKGMTMYGDDACPNCQAQKQMFQQDFEQISYVNCVFHQDECGQKNLPGYPVWMRDGKQFPGVQNFSELAQISGCTAP